MFDILKSGLKRVVRVAGSATGASAIVKLAGDVLGVNVPKEVYGGVAVLAPAVEKMGREVLRRKKGDPNYSWIKLLRDIAKAVYLFCDAKIQIRKGGEKNE